MQVQYLDLLSGLRILCCYKLPCRSHISSDLVLLWCRPAAEAPIGPLAQKLPYGLGVAWKEKKKKKLERSMKNAFFKCHFFPPQKYFDSKEALGILETCASLERELLLDKRMIIKCQICDVA